MKLQICIIKLISSKQVAECSSISLNNTIFIRYVFPSTVDLKSGKLDIT